MSLIDETAKKRWLGIFATVAVILFVFNSCRVNSPENTAPVPEPKYTHGSIVNETVSVPAGKYVVFDVNLNRRASLKGRYHSENYQGDIGMFVLTEDNFEKFKEGEDFKSIVSAGNTPGGKTQRTLEPGVYKIIIDNRHETEKDINVICEFEVDKP